MRQSTAQSSEQPPRETSHGSRATTRGASGGLLVLMIEDGSTAALSDAAATEIAQNPRRTGPVR